MNPLSLLFKKQYAVEEKIQRLLRFLEDMAHLYQAAYEAYLEGSIEEFSQRNKELSEIEKKMDELGYQIQMTLLHESLMPNSRDDLLWFLTKLDKVPSSFKHPLGDIFLEKPRYFSRKTGNSRRVSFIHEKHAHTYTFSSTGFGACDGFTVFRFEISASAC